MADISKIKVGSNVYDIKDSVARSTMVGAITILGTTTTALEDNATTNPITVNGESVTAVANNAVFYESKEFVFDGTNWHEFGDMTGLGDLAQHDLDEIEFTTTVTLDTPSTTVATTSSESATVTRSTDVAIGVATNETWNNVEVSYGGTTGTDAETLIISTTSKSAAKTIEVTTQPAFTATVDVPATFTTSVGVDSATTTAAYES